MGLGLSGAIDDEPKINLPDLLTSVTIDTEGLIPKQTPLRDKNLSKGGRTTSKFKDTIQGKKIDWKAWEDAPANRKNFYYVAEEDVPQVIKKQYKNYLTNPSQYGLSNESSISDIIKKFDTQAPENKIQKLKDAGIDPGIKIKDAKEKFDLSSLNPFSVSEASAAEPGKLGLSGTIDIPSGKLGLNDDLTPPDPRKSLTMGQRILTTPVMDAITSGLSKFFDPPQKTKPKEFSVQYKDESDAFKSDYEKSDNRLGAFTSTFFNESPIGITKRLVDQEPFLTPREEELASKYPITAAAGSIAGGLTSIGMILAIPGVGVPVGFASEAALGKTAQLAENPYKNFNDLISVAKSGGQVTVSAVANGITGKIFSQAQKGNTLFARIMQRASGAGANAITESIVNQAISGEEPDVQKAVVAGGLSAVQVGILGLLVEYPQFRKLVTEEGSSLVGKKLSYEESKAVLKKAQIDPNQLSPEWQAANREIKRQIVMKDIAQRAERMGIPVEVMKEVIGASDLISRDQIATKYMMSLSSQDPVKARELMPFFNAIKNGADPYDILFAQEVSAKLKQSVVVEQTIGGKNDRSNSEGIQSGEPLGKEPGGTVQKSQTSTKTTPSGGMVQAQKGKLINGVSETEAKYMSIGEWIKMAKGLDDHDQVETVLNKLYELDAPQEVINIFESKIEELTTPEIDLEDTFNDTKPKPSGPLNQIEPSDEVTPENTNIQEQFFDDFSRYIRPESEKWATDPRTKKELIDRLRSSAEELGYSYGGFKGATDEELFDAAQEIYVARVKEKENNYSTKKDDLEKEAKKHNNSTEFIESQLTHSQEEGVLPKTGEKFIAPFYRSKESAPNMGNRFAQNLEPKGKYVAITSKTLADGLPKESYVSGIIKLNNPLVIEYKSSGQDGWKKDLSEKYDGLVGENLTEAIKKDGYDGIITVNSNQNIISETIAFDDTATEEGKNLIEIWNKAHGKTGSVDNGPGNGKLVSEEGTKYDAEIAKSEILNSLRRIREEKTNPEEIPDSVGSSSRVSPTEKAVQSGHIDYSSISIKSSRDVAEIASVYRSGKVENYQVIYVKDGKVLGHRVVTSRLPAMVTWGKNNEKFYQFSYKIISAAKRLGATDVYVSHNHPSGDPTPSEDDIRHTRYLIANFKKANLSMKGHVITNGEKYSVVSPESLSFSHLYDTEQFEKAKPNLSIPAVTKPVLTPKDASVYLKEFAHGDKLAVVLINVQGNAFAIEYISPEKNVSEYVTSVVNQTRAHRYFIVGSEEAVSKINKNTLPPRLNDVIAFQKNGSARYLGYTFKTKGKSYNDSGIYGIRESGQEYENIWDNEEQSKPAGLPNTIDELENIKSFLKESSQESRVALAKFKKSLSRKILSSESKVYPDLPSFVLSNSGIDLDKMASENSDLLIRFGYDPTGAGLHDFIIDAVGYKDGEKSYRVKFNPETPENISLAKQVAEKLITVKNALAKVKKIGVYLSERPNQKTVIRKMTGQVDLSSEIKTTEAKALAEKLRQQSMAARRAMVQTKRDIFDIQKEITKTIMDSPLPADQKAKFLSTIKNVQTKQQMEKALPLLEQRIDALEDMIEKRALIKKFKEMTNKTDLKRLRPEYKSAIEEIIDGLSASSLSDAKIKKLVSMAQYIEEHPDNMIPTEKISQLKALSLKSLRDMTTEEIKLINDSILHLIKLNDLKNKIIVGKKVRDFFEIEKEAVGNIKRNMELKKIKVSGLISTEKDNTVGHFVNTFTSDNYNPELKCNLLDGSQDGVIKKVLYDGIDKGVDKEIRIKMQAHDFFKERTTGINMSKWSSLFQAKKANIEMQVVTLSSGQSVQLTIAEKIAFNLHARNKKNLKHLLKGGFSFSLTKSKRIPVTAEDVAALGSLTEEQMAVADAMYDYFNIIQKKNINDASVNILGFEVATEPDYFPINTNPLFRKKNDLIKPSDFSKFTLEGMGMFKERQNAGNPIVLEDAFAVVFKSLEKSAAYCGLAEPLRSAKALLNDTRFQITVISHGRKNFLNSLKKYIEAIESRAVDLSTIDQLTQALINKLDTAVLGLNPFVIAKQPVSYLLAATEMDLKYLLTSFRPVISAETNEEVKKYAPQIYDRFMGNVTREAGEVHQVGRVKKFFTGEEVISRKIMEGITNADKAAVGSIWIAVKKEISEKFPELSGDAYFEKVYERAWEVIRKTQPTFHIKDRSDIGMNQQMWSRLLTKYSSQRNKNLMILRRAIAKYNTSEKTIKDKTNLMASLVNLIFVSSALIGAINEGRNWLYGRNQKKKNYNFAQAMIGQIAQTNIGNFYFVGDLFNSLVSKVESGTFAGYDITNIAYSTLDQVVDTGANAIRAIKFAMSHEKYKSGAHKGEEKWKRAAQSAIIGTVDVISKIMYGVPEESVRKLLYHSYERATEIIEGDKKKKK